MSTTTAPTATAPIVNPAVIDALRPGDVVTLRRYRPADGNGPARLFVGRLTIARLERQDDWAGEPNWYLEGREEDMRGCWAVGRVPCGMVTTLELAETYTASCPICGETFELPNGTTMTRGSRPCGWSH